MDGCEVDKSLLPEYGSERLDVYYVRVGYLVGAVILLADISDNS